MVTIAGLLASLGIAWAVDHLADRKGMLPPAFVASPGRRIAAGVALAAVVWVAMIAPLGTFGQVAEVTDVPWPLLFAVHAVLAATLAVWLGIAFAGSGRSVGSVVRGQLGLGPPDPREIALGIVTGIGFWVPALLCSAAIALAGWSLGWIDLDAKPPGVVLWLVAQPVALRLALAMSAGFFEEVFFRGFLQPRIGVTASTLLFIAAHASYGQAPLLGGVAFLSIAFAGLVAWRHGLWAAIVAHTTFDVLQLLVVIPAVVRELPAAP